MNKKCEKNSIGNAERMMSEIYRELKPKGSFICIYIAWNS